MLLITYKLRCTQISRALSAKRQHNLHLVAFGMEVLGRLGSEQANKTNSTPVSTHQRPRK